MGAAALGITAVVTVVAVVAVVAVTTWGAGAAAKVLDPASATEIWEALA
jgi:hypothetical protein